jgi:hypothetical protein
VCAHLHYSMCKALDIETTHKRYTHTHTQPQMVHTHARTQTVHTHAHTQPQMVHTCTHTNDTHTHVCAHKRYTRMHTHKRHTHTHTHTCPSHCMKREMSQCYGTKQHTQTEKLQQIGQIQYLITKKQKDMHTDRCGNTGRRKCRAKGSGKEVKIRQLNLQISEPRILIRLLRMYCPWNWEFG